MSLETSASNLPAAIDVLIVGAGPVGMTLALTLQRVGVNVTIVDREAKTGQFTRAAIVWPRTLEVFDLLGIVGDWLAEGVPVQAMHLNIDGSGATVQLGHIDSPHPFPLGIGQDKTEALLDARLRTSGADYRRGVEVTSVVMDADGATATLRDVASGNESGVRAHWVVGCEGSRSVVREAAGIGRQGGQNAGVQIVQGDFRVRTSYTLPPGHGFVWSGGTRSLLLLIPLHRDGHYRVLLVRDDDGKHGEPTIEEVQTEARRVLPDIAISDPLWCNRFRTQHQIADHYRSGRAVICGDAAHVWVPIGGQGMNIGIQDAFDLGWKLAGVVKGELPETALDVYESERRPIGASHVSETEKMYGALVDVKSPLANVARRLIPHLAGLAPVSGRIAARFSEIDFHYAAGALVAAHNGYGKVSAGQRAPDAYVARPATGEPSVRLFDLFRAGRWVALGWVLDARDAASVTDALAALPKAIFDGYLVDAHEDDTPLDASADVTLLRDRPRFATDAYGVRRTGIHLIRPDGVVGYSGPADIATLTAYCQGAFAATMEA